MTDLDKLKETAKGKKESNQGNQLVEIGRESVRKLFHDESEEPYAWMLDGSVVRVRSANFKRMLKSEYYERQGKPAQSEAVNQAVDILELEAFRGEEHTLGLRYAWDSNTLYIDLGYNDWKVLRVNASGAELIEPYKPIFKRFRGSQEFIYDLTGKTEHVREFIQLFKYNDSRDYETLIIGKLGTDMLPHIGHAIFNATGDQGALKTTFTQALTQIIDPQVQRDHDAPDKKEELASLLSHHYAVCLDNITGFMGDFKVDMIVKSAIGSYFSKRQLYTDEDEVLQFFHNVFNNNGINNPSNRPDYLDREIKALMRRPSNAERLPDTVIQQRLSELLPKVRGALINAIVKAIPLFETVQAELKELPRMADFAIHGEAISRAMGIEPKKFIDAYFDSIGKSQLDALDSDIVAEIVEKFLEDNKQWTGTSTELWKLLQEEAQQIKGFPKSPKALTSKLNVLRVDLEAIGIAWIDLKDSKHRKQLKKIEPTSLIPANSAQPAHSAQSLENTDPKPMRNVENDSAQDNHNSALPHDSAFDSASKKPLEKAGGAESAEYAESEGTKFSELKDEILKLIESEAPKAKYHSLKPKAISDMIGSKIPEVGIPEVFKICEEAVKEGILLKNKAGGYSMNPEWLNGGGL